MPTDTALAADLRRRATLAARVGDWQTAALLTEAHQTASTLLDAAVALTGPAETDYLLERRLARIAYLAVVAADHEARYPQAAVR